MLWLKKSKREDSTPDGGTVRSTRDADASSDVRSLEAGADTAVAFLRAFGRHAFEVAGADVAAFSRQCEAWASHLAIGAPHPNAIGADVGVLTKSRDWAGARHFVSRRREEESAYISTSVANLRAVIADLTESLATTLIEDRASDRTLTDQVERLRVASSSTSVDALRQEVAFVTALLSRLAEDRSRMLREQLVALDQKVAALSDELQEVRHESSLDGLTRVFNRGAFDRAFRRMHRLGAVSADPSCLVIADMDNLKQINDQHGHQAGDEAIRVFADHLVRSFPRRSDFVARYGGDEMVAILPRTRERDSARLATRFIEGVRAAEVSVGATTVSLRASVGLAEMRPGDTAEAWLARADRALYEAKAAGRDRLMIAP
jgi:diguanylate cyclase (GGDEF)-like protein